MNAREEIIFKREINIFSTKKLRKLLLELSVNILKLKSNHILKKSYTRNIGARTKVMGRKQFQESINYCFHKQKVAVNMYVDEFRGDPLFKTARKYLNKRNG